MNTITITILLLNHELLMTILQLKTFKTQISTNIRALIYLGRYGFVAE